MFIASIVLHLMRIFFTGAYRKPRDLNYFIGLTMLMLAILEGFAGYSLVDDLLSGMGLAIAYSVAMSIPFIGGAARDTWCGADRSRARAASCRGWRSSTCSLHPGGAGDADRRSTWRSIMRQHHSQFPGRGRRERNVVGTPMWPAYALRSIGLLLAVAAVLFLIGGLIQINPIWQWGPYHPYLSENGAQPDWYIGWLIGALRLMPNWEPAIGEPHDHPEPVLGRRAVPAGRVRRDVRLAVRSSGGSPRDHRRHDLLDRPRDRPRGPRSAPRFLSWVVIIFAVGSTDRLFFRLHISYSASDPFLARRRLGAADRRVLRHACGVPLAAAKRRAPAARLARGCCAAPTGWCDRGAGRCRDRQRA